MGLIGKAMVLGGGYLIAKKLMDKNEQNHQNSNNNRDQQNHQQDNYNNQQNRQQDDYNNQQYRHQDNYNDQNRSQQDMYRDQKDFVPAPVYRDTQPQIQYNDYAGQQQQQQQPQQQQRQMSPGLNGERYYGDEKARSEAGKPFN